jgi:hypothetical protein
VEPADLKHCSISAVGKQSDRIRNTAAGYGLVEYCYRLDGDGRQHFNFEQRVWLRRQVPMAVTPVLTVALETLAVNLLSLAVLGREGHASIDVTSTQGLRLARLFCEQCLLTANADGWVMPRASVRAWIAAQRRRGRPL